MKLETKISIVGILAIIGLVAFYAVSFQQKQRALPTRNVNSPMLQNVNGATAANTTVLGMETIGLHSTPGDCWLLIEGKVYDVTQYLQLHPGGQAIITPFCGKDATTAFLTKAGQGTHSTRAFEQLGALYLGNLNDPIASSAPTAGTNANVAANENVNAPVNANTNTPIAQVPPVTNINATPTTVKLDLATIAQHSIAADCWLIISGKVYAVTGYLNTHPGGRGIVIPFCGKDATRAFQTKAGAGSHSTAAYQELVSLLIGSVGSSTTTSTLQQVQRNSQSLPATTGDNESDND
jgi:cytochrome b involved in lipid metabolism